MAIAPPGTGRILPGFAWAGLVPPLEFVPTLEATLPFGLAVLPALAFATVRGDGNAFPLVLGVADLVVAVPLLDGGCGSCGMTGTGLVVGSDAACGFGDTVTSGCT